MPSLFLHEVTPIAFDWMPSRRFEMYEDRICLSAYQDGLDANDLTQVPYEVVVALSGWAVLIRFGL